MGYLSKLDAVNMMMLSAGESLVADLEEASGIDTGIAEFLLEQVSLDYQLRGLAENKITRLIEPNTDGLILLGYPNNDYTGILEASLSSAHYNDDGFLIKAKVTETNPPRLYNITDQTDVWDATEDHYVTIVSMIKWEQLDTVHQRAILTTAMRKYQMLIQGDRQADAVLAQDEMLNRIKSRASNISDQGRNILSDKNAVYRKGTNYNANRYWSF
jgi:hypothetical protein